MRLFYFKTLREEAVFNVLYASTSYLKISNGVVRLKERLNAKPLIAEVEDASEELYAFVVDEHFFFGMSLLNGVFLQIVLVFFKYTYQLGDVFPAKYCSRERLCCALTCSSRQPK